MSKKHSPTNSPNNREGGAPLLEDEEITESIDLGGLFRRSLTISGSFDVGEIIGTSFGRLLEALPTPALLVARTQKIVFANGSCLVGESDRHRLVGADFSEIFARPQDSGKLSELIRHVYVSREPAVFEAAVILSRKKIWAKIHLRSIRLVEDRVILALIQDLTLEKTQILLNKQHESELREAHAQLEKRVDERTSELRKANLQLKREIVHREKAEADLREAQADLEQRVQDRTAELQTAYEEMKRFTYIVSHDMRVPLMNIKGFGRRLKWALDEIREALPPLESHAPEARDVLEKAFDQDIPEAFGFIESSIGRMETFVNAVLKLSKIGHRELRFERVDMNDVVQAALRILAHQIEEHHIRVRVEKLPAVTADRISMEQVVGNILANAVNYIASDRESEILVSAERGANEVTFSIEDNGRGIRAEEMSKVFEFFRRAGEQDVPGDGVGLAYVSILVRRHGGRIWCESEHGVGSQFRFTVPNQPLVDIREV